MSGFEFAKIRNIFSVLLLFFTAVSFASVTDAERREIEARHDRFYRTGDAESMNLPVNRYSPKSGTLAPRRSHRIAEDFSASLCQSRKKHFKGYVCPEEGGGNWAAIESNDRVEQLVRGWISQNEFAYGLDHLPTEGRSQLPLWSDDYWRTRWGQTSYRYHDKIEFKNYREAVSAYSQPNDWHNLLRGLSPAEVAREVVKWSPSEKYDLSVGDEAFTLTTQQKRSGVGYENSSGDVEEWMGLCHGWAAAAIVVNPPTQPVSVVGARGATIEWYPPDMLAMATLAWAEGKSGSNFIGGRCNQKDPRTHKNGRIQAQECFDNNPATFHVAIGNLIGRKGLSFVMDKTFDYEVWNQPVRSYEVTYFNPLDHNQKSKKWQDVAVDYDRDFKRADRFQSPLTRGVRRGRRYDDSRVAKVVGVEASVEFLVEHEPPKHEPKLEEAEVERVTYIYDLELENSQQGYYPTGGEWHENTHPDFLWIPTRDAVAVGKYDSQLGPVSLNQVGHPTVTNLAKQQSQSGQPLCRVVEALFGQAAGANSYRCR